VKLEKIENQCIFLIERKRERGIEKEGERGEGRKRQTRKRRGGLGCSGEVEVYGE